jgi:hypothetical protein
LMNGDMLSSPLNHVNIAQPKGAVSRADWPLT